VKTVASFAGQTRCAEYALNGAHFFGFSKNAGS
jgi:hypothetical protein